MDHEQYPTFEQVLSQARPGADELMLRLKKQILTYPALLKGA